MTISSLLSSFFPVVYNDSLETEVKGADQVEAHSSDIAEDKAIAEEEGNSESSGEEAEPEDVHPVVREECQNSQKCAPLTKHFQHCQEKVESGKGFQHEDCVEELYVRCFPFGFAALLTAICQFPYSVHMMHCVDNCAAPKLFSKLR